MGILNKDSKWYRQLIDVVTDDERRRRVQFYGVFLLLGCVSAVMTLINVFTDKGTLTWVTFAFALMSFLNYGIARYLRVQGLAISSALFMLELVGMFVYFIVSGNPDGFSAIWICMLPACGMLLFGIRAASLLSAGMWLILVFFFWTQLGRSLLQYAYSETFLMRFPILYLTFFLLSLLLELIRHVTQRELSRLRERYQFLSAHDTLTTLLNRSGLKERKKEIRVKGDQGVLFIDIDHFKQVNDTCGHATGDAVLAMVAEVVKTHVADAELCRWGGEEIVVWFPGGDFHDEIADDIRRDVEKTTLRIPGSDKRVGVTVSIGVATGDRNTPLDELILLADERMYQAKSAGRNRVVYD